MKTHLASILMLSACFSVSAVQVDTNVDTKATSFSCMNSETFEINASCMSDKIANNDSFLSKQANLFEQHANTNHAMATLTIDAKTLDITVVAHKDAYLAKVDK